MSKQEPDVRVSDNNDQQITFDIADEPMFDKIAKLMTGGVQVKESTYWRRVTNNLTGTVADHKLPPPPRRHRINELDSFVHAMMHYATDKTTVYIDMEDGWLCWRHEFARW